MSLLMPLQLTLVILSRLKIKLMQIVDLQESVMSKCHLHLTSGLFINDIIHDILLPSTLISMLLGVIVPNSQNQPVTLTTFHGANNWAHDNQASFEIITHSADAIGQPFDLNPNSITYAPNM